MPTDPAFIRAVEGLKRDVPSLEYAPQEERAAIVRAVLKAIREPDIAMRRVSTFAAAEQDWPAMIDAILIQDPGIPVVGRLVADSEGPWDKHLREEADRQYPTGEEG